MATYILHKANTRGHANHGWLETYHTFSFAGYYDPERIHFGALRVINDDYIAPGMGFGTHPHDNMEIITIPLEGDLEHRDSMGNTSVIYHGDVQVMSAGTGIQHSEYNANRSKGLKLFQIWVFPDKKNVVPRYQQISLNVEDRRNKLQQILSPNPNDEGVWIHQKAWFHLGEFDKDFTLDYSIKASANGVYALVVKGSIEIDGKVLESRDGLGIYDTDKISIKALSSDAEILLMEVPMKF
jgi:Pirin-related protein